MGSQLPPTEKRLLLVPQGQEGGNGGYAHLRHRVISVRIPVVVITPVEFP